MDADISDILASVSAPSIDHRTLDLQALTRAWINERTSPDLLPYPTDLIQRANDGIKRQIEIIEDMTGSMDPSKNFTLVILQTELERMKFLVRSYLRARIAKVDKFPIHYRQRLLQAEPDDEPLLSTLESQYLEAHQSLLTQHYHASFLSVFPQNLHRMDDSSGGVHMVDKPDEDAAVFCRVLRDCYVERPVYGGIDMVRGDIWVLRWSNIAERVKRGDVELI
ncbi:DNA replication complex GINS protein SLD5 [Cercospora beticola]|uniref:DNA replication complex GINS protein SLD5 n=1 Tax=Cercospora beticola TaxID=122368 RepID=A0A2G5HNT0_CERBT|nr:DNA replication complex GINS protein SLD5 [Cercospora beticola]PIA94209.1 DNA replication complex GINS protein SLD5 [Cercospora beticola]WPB05097.1 hypothetical protein RHO25_009747 [Cercospora beticola]CAK1364881.1 unnamed protein product [Cercospora beticola]